MSRLKNKNTKTNIYVKKKNNNILSNENNINVCDLNIETIPLESLSFSETKNVLSENDKYSIDENLSLEEKDMSLHPFFSKDKNDIILTKILYDDVQIKETIAGKNLHANSGKGLTGQKLSLSLDSMAFGETNSYRNIYEDSKKELLSQKPIISKESLSFNETNELNLFDPNRKNKPTTNETWSKIRDRDIHTNEQKNTNVYNSEIKIYDNDNIPRYKKKIMSETYEQYILKLNMLDKQKSKWIYNIIDGKSEQEKIIYVDDKFILMPTYFWNEEDLCKMHLLAIVKNTKLKSLRDLRSQDVPLLEHILLVSRGIIKNKYNIEQNVLKIYIHYPPSAWLFHIHFEMMINTETTSSVEYSHEISQVIFNLKLCSEYYKLFDEIGRAHV